MGRKLKLQVQISIDGFIAGPNGEMDFFTWNWSNDIKKYVTELTNSMDTIILGRKLAQGFIPHWLTIAENINNPEYEFGKQMTDPRKIIFTKTLDNVDWKTTELAKGDLVQEINKLKNESGKDIIVYGGAEFVSNLLKESLIDELHLFVNPVAIGKGLPIFQNLDKKQEFKLLHTQAFDCGINVIAYKLK
ncbi:MAG: dihydrofolate reductase [Ignavibacteriae bacterium]|nr:dihydrofolate reductase [Ignavibacteriota bacterium]